MATTVPSTMRASQWLSNAGGIEKHLKINPSASLPKNASSLPAGHTLVKIDYGTVNPVDFKVAEVPIVGHYMFRGTSPGLDYAGTVVNSTLPHLKPGEKVFGSLAMPNFGTLAEYAVAPKEGCVPLPPDVAPEDAACAGIVGLTAYQTIAPFVKAGDKVSLGADDVIDYRTQPVVETLKRKGTQFDLIVDNVFHDTSIYFDAHHYLKPEGRFVTIAGSPTIKGITDILKVFLTPSWFGGGQRKLQFVTCEANAEGYAQLAKWMQEKKVKAVIEKVYDLKDADQAFVRLKSSRARGKLVVKVAQ